MAFVYWDGYLDRIKNLEEGKYYKGVRFDGDEICYSYNSHTRFRESLVKLIDRKDLLNSDGKILWESLDANIDFYKLISFSDCEGVLDFEVCESLYIDFKKHQQKAKETFSDWDYYNYVKWLKSFEFAKDNGAVVFH